MSNFFLEHALPWHKKRNKLEHVAEKLNNIFFSVPNGGAKTYPPFSICVVLLQVHNGCIQ